MQAVLWQPEEDQIIRDFYAIEGLQKTKERLPNRTLSAVQNRALLFSLKSGAVNRAWTPDEDACIRTQLPTVTKWAHLAPFFPNRTPFAVKQRALSLGLKVPHHRRWTAAEDALINQHYETHGAAGLVALLPGRTRPAIIGRGIVLGRRNQALDWTTAEDAVLREHYPTTAVSSFSARLPGRPLTAIASRARKLGIQKVNRNHCWTEEEDALIELHLEAPGTFLAALLPHRAPGAVVDRRSRLRRAKLPTPSNGWTAEEDEVLRREYPIGGMRRVKILLPHYPVGRIRVRVDQFGLHDETRAGGWTEEENDLIRQYFPSGGVANVQAHGLKRSKVGIVRHAAKIGVRFNRQLWTDSDLRVLQNIYASGGAVAVVAQLPHWTEKAVRAKAAELHLVAPFTGWTHEEDSIIRTLFPTGGMKAVRHLLPNRTVPAIHGRKSFLGVSKNPDPRVIWRCLVNQYITGARTRGYSWQLTFEEAKHFFEADCHYCGAPPATIIPSRRRISFVYNGMDRVDNTKGYTLENLVTCCGTCNMAKRAMTYTDFVAWLDQLAFFRGPTLVRRGVGRL